MLSHILYGTARLTHGGLILSARSAGMRGQQVSLTITTGSPLSVAVNFKGDGAFVPGDISVTAPAGTTEEQFLAALSESANFKKIAVARQAGGDGSSAIATLVKTPFAPAAGGLRQQLEARLGIIGWDDRDLLASGKPVGLLMPWEATAERQSPDDDRVDHWEGSFYVGIAFQHDTPMEAQNATLDLFRRALYQSIKVFDHEDLTDIGPPDFGYGNKLKDEVTGEAFDHARLRVAASCPIKWTEPAFDPEDIVEVPFDHARIGLYREPLETEVRITGDGEVKDQDLVIQQ